jgi:hypothetical protein
MAHGSWPHPDVGYWAASYDPTGRLHPLFLTSRVGSHWITIGTLPTLIAGYPLYQLGGYRALLVFPIAGAVLSALAARRLSRRLGSRTDGWTAFWAVGLASPVTVYALDFWDHALGLGLLLWGVASLVDLLDRDRPADSTRMAVARRGAVAGLCFGIAATMRTEAFVYAAVAGLVVAAVLAWRRRWASLGIAGTALAAVALGCQFANLLAERALLGEALRGGRSADTLKTAGDLGLGGRLRIAWFSGVALRGGTRWVDLAVAVALVAAVAVAAWSARRGAERVTRFAAVAALLCVLTRVAAGWGFVPGMLAATPFAVVGLLWGWRATLGRVLLAIAVGGFALSVATQFPMVDVNKYTWAGRYVLASGALAAVVGITILERWGRPAVTTVLAGAVLVTAYGVAMLTVRTHDVSAWAEAVAARPEALVISRVDEPFRDAGAVYTPDRRWLTASDDERLREALRIADQIGAPTLAVVEYPVPASSTMPGWCRGDAETVPWVPTVPLRITHYERATADGTCTPVR